MRIRIIKVPKQYKGGGALDKEEINPGLDAMVKARLALDSHFGNPTARRMTNYDTRSYTFPDGRRGNVYVGSYGNYVTPQIQDVDGELKFIEDPWSDENWERSEAQSMKFESPRDAEYFAKNYKRFAPMMSLYSKGGLTQNAAKWHHSFGGELNTQGGNFTNGLLYINNGGSHEENPYEGVPMGVDNQGTPNLVEEGETVFNDYVFSKRLKVPKALRKKYKLRDNITFADASKKLGKESEERPNDPISKRGLEAMLNDLTVSQEEIRAKKEAAKMQDAIQQEQMMGQPNTFGTGGDTKEKNQTQRANFKPVLSTNYDMINRLSPESQLSYTKDIAQDIPLNQQYYVDGQGIKVLTSKRYAPKDKSLYEINNPATSNSDNWTPLDTRLRYLPAWASGIASITDAIGLTNKPDYSNADAVLQAARSAGIYKPVSFNPIGNYLSYNPFDRNYYLNKLNAQAGASRRALLQNAGMNRGAATAALLAADYNNQNQVGQLAKQAEEYNLEQRQKVEQFNRETNSANSSGMLQADTANQQALQNLRQFTLNATATAAELRQKELEAKSAARSLNLSNFINSLGDIGRENLNINMINTDKSKYFRFNKDGTIEYKGGLGNDPFYQALVESYNKNKQKNKQTGLTE